MLTFNLKKEWFEKIKNGEKTHEYREVKDYWTNRIMHSMYHEYITMMLILSVYVGVLKPFGSH